MRVSRRSNPKTTDNNSTTAATELQSPINFPSSTFESSTDHFAQDSNKQQQPQKSSTRVWRLKKYRNDDAEQQSTLVQNNIQDGSDLDNTKQLTVATTTITKKGTRRLPPRRPKTDKNGNPLEFVFVDASPQQQQQHSPQLPSPVLPHDDLSTLAVKKQGKFPKNIFRLSSGSKKNVPTPSPPKQQSLNQFSPQISPPALKLSSSLQDLTRARNPSISSIGRSPLKRSYTSLIQQLRLPKPMDQDCNSSKTRSDSSNSMLCIKIDDNGRAAVIQQQQQQLTILLLPAPLLSKSISSSSSVSDLSSLRAGLLLNSSRSRSPPLFNNNPSPVLQPLLGGGASASTTPYSLSATDEEEEEEEQIINFDHSFASEQDIHENDALVAFTKVMGTKRKQLSRKGSTLSISSNFNNMTLTNGTPVSSPVLNRPIHQRSLSSLSQSASTSRRHSPVRSTSRRLKHSQSVSLEMGQHPVLFSSQDPVYYQSGINNKPLVNLQTSRQQPIQQNIYYPLHSSTSLYNLNTHIDNQGSNESSPFEYATLGPALDLSTSFTTASVSSVATPTSPEHPKLQQQQNNGYMNLFKKMDNVEYNLREMNKLNSIDSTKTLTFNNDSHHHHHQQKAINNNNNNNSTNAFDDFNNSLLFNETMLSLYHPDAKDDAFDLFDFISYDNNNTGH